MRLSSETFWLSCLNPPVIKTNPPTGGFRPAALIIFSLIEFTLTVLQAEPDPGVAHI